MRPDEGFSHRPVSDLRLQTRVLRLLRAGLVLVAMLLTMAFFEDPEAPPAPVQAAPPTTVAPGTTVAPSTSTTLDLIPTSTLAAPTPAAVPAPGPFVVPEGEIEPDAKQLAADIVYALMTYEESDDPGERYAGVAGSAGADLLAEAGAPLTHSGQWSRSEVVYPQLGGLTDGKASVMVVARQTVGSGSEEDHSVVRTLDVRLVQGTSGWEFEELASAGGVFDDLEGLTLAHAVASDPRIEMPDSTRLDILGGGVSPALLELMADLAEVAPYGITVMVTGHPYHVFGTDRISHHTIGRAIDIHRVAGNLVVDDRGDDSATRAVVEWLLARPDVEQVGSPWDLDGPDDTRSFADVVHQDHIHVAVEGDD